MTATVAEPRLGQLSELVDIIRDKRTHPEHAPWYDGFIVGFAAAICDDQALRDQLIEARATAYAHAHTIDEALAMPWLAHMVDTPARRRNYLRACGVLFGWKQATAERPDAEECTTCQDRILVDADDPASCTPCVYHGWFCSPECQRAACMASCDRGDD